MIEENTAPVDAAQPEDNAVEADAPTPNPQDLKKAIEKRDRFKSERDELAQRLQVLESERAQREREQAEGDSAKKLQLLEKELQKAQAQRDELLSGLEARDKAERNRAVLSSIAESATDRGLLEAAYEKLLTEGALEDGPEDAEEARKKAEKVMRKRYPSLFTPKNTQPPADAGHAGVIPGAAPADPAARTAQQVADESRRRGRPIPSGWQ